VAAQLVVSQAALSSKVITQYSPRPHRQYVYIAHARNGMPKEKLLPVLPSVLSPQSAGSMEQSPVFSSSQFLI
jgi:hypothetical protein